MIAAYVSGAARFGTPPRRLIAPTVGGAPRKKRSPANPSTAQMERRYGSRRCRSRSGARTSRPSHSTPQLA
ncbi:hypothetical protein SHIRM173S_11121 [Streptomyces hirsutus]